MDRRTYCLRCFAFILLLNSSFALLCEDVLRAEEDKVWEVEELRNMSGEEVDKCIPQLGRVKIPMEQAKVIWHAMKDFHGGAGSVPDKQLSSLHWITIAIDPKDYKRMSLSNIDVIENFGLFYDLREDQIKAIARKVKSDWGGKTPEDYTSYDLMALKQIICVFKAVEIERIHASAYKDAATAMGTLKKCPIETLQALAKLAVQEKAFGSPELWKEPVISTVGVVIDGLPPELLQLIPEQLIAESKKRIAQTTRESFNAKKNSESIKP